MLNTNKHGQRLDGENGRESKTPLNSEDNTTDKDL